MLETNPMKNRFFNIFPTKKLSLGERLTFLRKKQFLSQKTLSYKTGVDRGLISRYERGLDKPSWLTLKKLTLILGISESILIYGLYKGEVDYKERTKPRRLEFKLYKLAERIIIERKSRGWSQVDLANRSGIYFGQIAKYERCYSPPSLVNLIQLAEAFGVTIDYLLYGNASARIEEKNIENNVLAMVTRIINLPERNRSPILSVIDAYLNHVD